MNNRIASLLAGVLAGWAVSFPAAAAPLNIANVPLFLPGAVPPLNMLVMGRDHTLYYEAYNDASDLNDDTELDVGYTPGAVDYFGYFDSHKCYTYASGSSRFVPQYRTTTKICGGTDEWSGDFLNYITTSRIDALRKVLYGGSRAVDSATETVLERSFIPQDAHSWGKEYTSIADDGYDIRDYTPYNEPAAGERHLFANTTLLSTTAPLMRVSLGQTGRVWEWLSTERPVAANQVSPITDFTVRVEVCVAGLLEPNCREYTGVSKPIGLLQEFGEDDRMYFGLLSGSYTNNLAGGALRKNVDTITDEIDPTTGQFTATNGIIKAIDTFRITQFGGSYEYQPGWPGAWLTTRPIVNGEQPNWGNPLGEMLYETLRYFSDKGVPTGSFVAGMSDGSDAGLPLPLQSWIEPFDEYPRCSAPIALAISDVNPSFDTDQVPGNAFGGAISGDISGFSASSLGDTMWQEEVGGPSRHFIGQSGAIYDGAPTPKEVTSFANIRGLSPEAPAKDGGYYSASAAYYGRINDLSTATTEQKLRTYSVALASPLPRIEIPVGGRTVTLVPFAKSVGGCLGVDGTQGVYQPTNQIVDFYVEDITPTSGRFRVNFEDVEQGADHDMDAIATYEYKVVGSTVEVTVTSNYAAGCVIQHLGYVISGTDADGTYLVVRDLDTGAGGDVDYFLDSPAVAGDLPLTSTLTFAPGTSDGATVLKDPLWFAAKWGGFNDGNDNDLPDQPEEWDADANGTPDNYFLVTNALRLADQLRDAFDLILSVTSSAAAVATNSTRLDTETLIYQARFLSGDWTGQLLAYPLGTDGSLAGSYVWNAATLIPDHDDREIFTRDGTVPGAGPGVEFLWDELSTSQQAALDLSAGGTADGLGEDRVAWLRGDQTLEQQNDGPFRTRSTVLGDIINSDPVFVGAQNFGYEDLPASATEGATYQTFQDGKLAPSASGTLVAAKPMIYVGANDGMLHAFDAGTGEEHFAYVPSTLIPDLNKLTATNYKHRYYVDGQINVGDAYINGAWASVLVGTTGAGDKTVFALDVTDPYTFDADDVLWEFTDPDLGHVIGQPTVARMADGTWVAVFGNGYNSDNHRAVLFIVRLEDGVLLKKIDTGVGDVSTPNGLATPALLADGTRTIRTIYAGDLLGNLWKFDVSAAATTSWASAYLSAGVPAPLFTAYDAAGVAQPITAPLEIARHPRGGYMVFFGTGKFFETGDNIVGSTPQVQTFYGIWDNAAAITYTPTDRTTALTKQEILYEGKPAGSNFDVRITSNYLTDWDTKRGWYLDLKRPIGTAEGERVVSSPIIRGGRVIFPTLIPPVDPCGGDGGSWLMEFAAVSGGRLDEPPLDINEDGQIDAGDYVTVTVGTTTYNVPVSGVRSREGIIDTPAVIGAGATEFKLASGTSGNLEVFRERGLFDRARGSWRQLR